MIFRHCGVLLANGGTLRLRQECKVLGPGPDSSQKTWCHLYLEALTTKNMGIVAIMEYGYAATIVKVQARSCATSTNRNTDCCQCMLCAA